MKYKAELTGAGRDAGRLVDALVAPFEVSLHTAGHVVVNSRHEEVSRVTRDSVQRQRNSNVKTKEGPVCEIETFLPASCDNFFLFAVIFTCSELFPASKWKVLGAFRLNSHPENYHGPKSS